MAMRVKANQLTDILPNMPDELRFGGVLAVGGRLGVLIQKARSVIIGQSEILPEALHDALRQTRACSTAQ